MIVFCVHGDTKEEQQRKLKEIKRQKKSTNNYRRSAR